jgi:DNA-binding MarR family transcriptional regulator
MKIEEFLGQNPVFVLGKVSQQLAAEMLRLLKRERVNGLQGWVLVAIFFEADRAARPSELARSFRTGRANMSQCLSQLEKAGYLRRALSTIDSRSYEIRLTTEGRKKALRLIRVFDRLQEAFEAHLGAERITSSLAVLKRLPEAFRSRTLSSPAPR